MGNHLPVGSLGWQWQLRIPLPTAGLFLLKKKVLVYFLWKTVPFAFITVQSHKQPLPSREIFS